MHCYYSFFTEKCHIQYILRYNNHYFIIYKNKINKNDRNNKKELCRALCLQYKTLTVPSLYIFESILCVVKNNSKENVTQLPSLLLNIPHIT